MATKSDILANTYIPWKMKKDNKKYEWYEHDLMTYFYDLKHEQLASNTDDYFKRARVISFDKINHECGGDPLKNPETFYQEIRKKDFSNYKTHVQNSAILSTIKSECDEIYFEHGFLENHFKSGSKIDIEKDLKSNGFFGKKSKKRIRSLIVPN